MMSSESLRRPAWKWLRTASAAVLVALSVYRFAERPQPPRPWPGESAVVSLDANSLMVLRDLIETFTPADEQLSRVRLDADAILAVPPLADLAGISWLPEVPPAADLDEDELQEIGYLVGGVYWSAGASSPTEEL